MYNQQAIQIDPIWYNVDTLHSIKLLLVYYEKYQDSPFNYYNYISGVMISMLAWSAVDCGLEPLLG